MLFNGKIEGFMGTFAGSIVVDIFEKTSATEQAYNISAVKNIHAAARSVFILERYDQNNQERIIVTDSRTIEFTMDSK